MVGVCLWFGQIVGFGVNRRICNCVLLLVDLLGGACGVSLRFIVWFTEVVCGVWRDLWVLGDCVLGKGCWDFVLFVGFASVMVWGVFYC